MIIQAHYSENIIASIEMNIHTNEYTVKVNRGSKIEKTHHKEHGKALQQYMKEIKT
jgi:hypothetical protein